MVNKAKWIVCIRLVTSVVAFKESSNQIKVLREPHMKHNVTQLEGKNEPVNYVLGNYFIDLELGNYHAEEASGAQTPSPISFDFHGLMRLMVK